MKMISRGRVQSGFTLIELLVVMAIVSVLIEFARVGPQASNAALRLARHPRTAAVAAQLEDFNQAADKASLTFSLSLQDDALAAGDPTTADIHLDSLQFFCDADTKLADLQSQVDGLLAAGVQESAAAKGRPADEQEAAERQKALLRAKNAIEVELPAVQKLANLLRTKGGATCPPVLQ